MSDNRINNHLLQITVIEAEMDDEILEFISIVNGTEICVIELIGELSNNVADRGGSRTSVLIPCRSINFASMKFAVHPISNKTSVFMFLFEYL